jgi:DNA polymerase-3 subunit epsilon
VQRSFDDLGTPLCDVTFCVIDLETTGGNRHDDAITEIGAVKVRGGECLGTFHTLVNPGRAIPPQITVLTGITDALVAPAPRIDAVLPMLLDFIGGSVMVAHNAGFDLGFLRAAAERAGYPPPRPTIVDTVALARRVVRDEVPDCRLGTLASRLRLDHRPTHRALDDALATTDLLHLLIERASGLGVLGLDDLVALGKLAGHPQAGKLRLTADLPRAPGVYLFCGPGDEVLYVGKATNLRQRVRSYFGSDDRRRVGPMLRETQHVRHLEVTDPLTAEVIELRLIARLLPRYNRAGTRLDRACYIRLDTSAPWPRLSIVRAPTAGGEHLGPLPSRPMATLVIDAIESALPLRRCSARLTRGHQPPLDTAPCVPAQLGVASCPCSGSVDATRYAEWVGVARRALLGDARPIVDDLTRRMTNLATAQRYEEAALVRDRIAALDGALRRSALVEALRAAGRAEVSDGTTTWVVDRARLVDVAVRGATAAMLPVAPAEPPDPGSPLPRHLAGEALCLARHFERHAARLDVRCDGEWRFPVGAPRSASEHGGAGAVDGQALHVGASRERSGDRRRVGGGAQQDDRRPAPRQPPAPCAGGQPGVERVP